MKQIRRFLLVLMLLPASDTPWTKKRRRTSTAPCAACHGEFGAGGKKGEYPRIAGQRARYMFQQLKSFQSQARINLPMYPYTKERDLPDEDMKLVSEWLEKIELPTKMPTFKGDEDALKRLQMVEKVMIVPRPEGDRTTAARFTRKIAPPVTARPVPVAADPDGRRPIHQLPDETDEGLPQRRAPA